MFVMIGFFVSVIVILMLALLWSNLFSINVLWSQQDVGTTIRDNTQSFMDNLDWILLCLYIGLHLSIIVLAFLLRTHPVMFIVSLGILIIMMLIAPVLSNYFNTIITNNSFTAIANNFPMTSYIMDHLPFLEFIWSILTMIFLYGFARTNE
jgi:hypothetical protein